MDEIEIPLPTLTLLRAVHRGHATCVHDDEGDLLFTLPGHHDGQTIEAVERIRRYAVAVGERIGRDALARELRRLLGAAERE